jgi:hypothetical protein
MPPTLPLAAMAKGKRAGGPASKAGPAGPRLSSVYVNLQKCPNLWKAPDNMPEGSDEPIDCAGPGGYIAGEQYSAATTWHIVTHPKTNFSLSIGSTAGQAWTAEPVMEFRLCDGRPFSVIQRIGVCDSGGETEACGEGRMLRKILVVEGLSGLEGHHAEIGAGPHANESARETADAWIAQTGCPALPTSRVTR